MSPVQRARSRRSRGASSLYASDFVRRKSAGRAAGPQLWFGRALD
jgi:hypothetical protein